MACVAIPPTDHLNLKNAQLLTGNARFLLFSWRRHAAAARCHKNSFEAFIFNWISLNGWAAVVTGSEQDTQWIRALAESRALQEIFNKLRRDPAFDRETANFGALWPIFRASEQRKLGIPITSDRSDVVKASLAAKIEHQPQCFVAHSGRPPADWPHTLHALYRVRNNVFHGEKGIWVDADRLIVDTASNVLGAFLDRSGIVDD